MTQSTPTATPADLEPMHELFDRYGEAWASHDAAAIAAFHADDGIFQLHAGDGGPVEGKAAIEATFAAFLDQFPDLAFEAQETLVADWGWTVRWRMSGTLAQPLDLDGETAQPGGRMDVDAVDVITVSDGLLTAKHTYVDWQTGLRQLGVA